MDTRDSGVIDLFAIHKEEEERVSSPSAAPSGPPPAVSFDTQAAYGEDADVDALAFAQQKSRKRTKMIGGAFGALAVVGILIAAITSGGSKDVAKDTATAAAPPAAEALPAPAVVTPAPAPTTDPAPPATAKADDNKGAYTRSAAIAAYKGKKSPAKGTAAKSSGIKMQKIQSGGTN